MPVDSGPTGLPCNPTSLPGGEYGLEGCLATYGGRTVPQKLPEEGHTLAPWVALTFEGSGSTITVSNDSSAATSPPNVACIQSFEFGYSDGFTCRTTIHDEEGGSFVQFMRNLLKDWVCLQNGSPASVRMKIQFGWVKSGCSSPLPLSSSRCYYCLSDSVETNYRDGKFHFEITGKDLCHRMFEGGSQTIYGGEGTNAIPITDAIRRFMCQDCPPNVGSVRFLRMEDGNPVPCPFKFGGTVTTSDTTGSTGTTDASKLLGPKGKWIASGQDKLRVVMRWLEGHVTDRDRSWIPQYNSELPNGELILWEDPKPDQAYGDNHWDANSIGTYVVNGGKKSPVIEFNPKIRWDFARLTSVGGQLGDNRMNATNRPGAATPGQPGNNSTQQPCAGHPVQTTNTETQLDNQGANAQQVQAEANAQSARTLKILTDNIEADLTIVGDPTLLPPSEAMMSKNCAIILINPYFLRRANFVNVNDDLEWLVQPTCNEVLSNKAWICKSICHRIEAGKYTTTIGVFLVTPGNNTPPNTPLGAWSGGWRPPAQC